MTGYRWGVEGPPLEAYSRVTNPERFASLHDVAAELLDRLELEFDAERRELFSLDPEVEEGIRLARPSVSLVPRDAGSAPLVIAFSAFPGVRVRFGRWCIIAFPTCGCDACDETAESEAERLKLMVDNLTEGCFEEAIRIRADGAPSKEWKSWSAGGRFAEWSQLDQSHARQLVGAGDQSAYAWRLWPKRS
jgi:hypothetical protein